MMVHYEVIGKGEPLLCLAGLGCSHSNFEFLIDSLKAQFTLVLLDNRGMGKSALALDDYSIQDLATDAIEIMNHLEFSKFYAMGISMGGFIAQMLTLFVPQKIQKLILLGTTSGGSEFAALPEISEDCHELAHSQSGDAKIHQLLKSLTHPSFKVNKPEVYERIFWERKNNLAPLTQLIKQNRAAKKFLLEPLPLEKINCPTLILCGENDRFVSPMNSQQLAHKIPHSFLEMIPESDHLFFMEKAPEVSQKIIKFLSETL